MGKPQVVFTIETDKELPSTVVAPLLDYLRSQVEPLGAQVLVSRDVSDDDDDDDDDGDEDEDDECPSCTHPLNSQPAAHCYAETLHGRAPVMSGPVVVTAEHRQSCDGADMLGPFDTVQDARDYVIAAYRRGYFDPNGCYVEIKALN